MKTNYFVIVKFNTNFNRSKIWKITIGPVIPSSAFDPGIPDSPFENNMII